jgi:SAM-dependent methyltransferase
MAKIHFGENDLANMYGRMILPFINYGYLKLILSKVKRGSDVLELGCGGGMELAGAMYHVTALDLSLSSLKGTPVSYSHRIQADAVEIEFLPGRFDAVFGSCFLEHLAPDRKAVLLEKIFRWLRPGGVLILLFDTESANPLFRWFRRYPDLYRRCFIDHDGHVGLESVSRNRESMRAHGFVEVRGIGLNRTIQHLPVYSWMAPYGSINTWISLASRAFGRIEAVKPLNRAFMAGVHLWDLSIGRLFPTEWSRLYLGCWMRP